MLYAFNFYHKRCCKQRFTVRNMNGTLLYSMVTSSGGLTWGQKGRLPPPPPVFFYLPLFLNLTSVKITSYGFYTLPLMGFKNLPPFNFKLSPPRKPNLEKIIDLSGILAEITSFSVIFAKIRLFSKFGYFKRKFGYFR